MVFALLLSVPVITAHAAETAENAAEIMPVKGGAKAMLSMTFDDGDFDTAVWLTEEFEKYDLFGSCMLILNKNLAQTYNPTLERAGQWRTLFAKGRLEPQSHSMTHAVLPTESWAANNGESNLKNNYPAKYQTEIVDSKTLLEQYFPDADILCFAASNNTLSERSYAEKGSSVIVEDGGAVKVAGETYYAIRQGARGLQSLDPATEGIDRGSWRNLLMSRFSDASGVSAGKKWINDAISEGQWLITLCHAITETTGDFNKAEADEFFAYASEKSKAGDLWVTDFSTATRYVREPRSFTKERSIWVS